MKNSTVDKLLKLLDASPLINSDGVTKQTKIYEFNGEKFRISYENSKGTPISWNYEITKGTPTAWNYKMCLSQYSKLEAKWNNLEDISVLDISPVPYYGNLPLSKVHCATFFKKMEKRLVKVYS